VSANLETRIGVPIMERGWLPEGIVRLGIRRLIRRQAARRRADAETAGGIEQVTERLVAELVRRRVAPVPEKANEQHYEVPAEFFREVLGRRMKYSCCYWSDDVTDLDAAEERMLDLTIDRAGVSDGMNVLDLGCGWGSAALAMAERFPRSRIKAVSNSRLQKAAIEQSARDRGLENVTVIAADMNDFDTDQRFDRVVSIEMFEHMHNYRELLSRIARWLERDGKLFVHVFCHRNHPYFFETEGAHNWMGRYFFTAGIMPSEDLLTRFQDALTLESQWRVSGTHYRRTADAWAQNMDRNRRRILPVLRDHYGPRGAAHWFVRWKVFFWACAETFGYQDGEVWGVAHYLFSRAPE
jgi:cyclopropane-fatty-acyl-phospholipid synthase